MTTAVDLIRRGYFPREVPPIFRTTDLADLLQNQPGVIPPSGGVWTECTPHNLARAGGLRRPLKVPNPRSFINLAQVIQTHWTEIDTHLRSQRFSLSRPVASPTSDRALAPRFRRGEAPKLRARYWRGQRFVLQTDISQFYSTLYTHSIPWALHGKAHAKANINKTNGDQIDRATRETSNGQTSGIPIGPDTSFAIAELVLTAIDAFLVDKLTTIRGYRHVDDYELAFKTRSEAEDALVAIEGFLADFELTLNPFKTRILELPEPFQETWVGELLTFPIRTTKPRETFSDTMAFFSKAFELAGEKRGVGLLKYALLRSRSIPVDKALWQTFQGLVLATVSVEPTTMPAALDLLQEKSVQLGEPIDKDAVQETIESQILLNAPLRNGSEVAWAIWTALTLSIDLSLDAATAIGGMEDDFVALLALDATARGRFPHGHPNPAFLWEPLVGAADAFTGQHWLLAYEATVQGWLHSAGAALAADPFFSVLQANGVHFYVPTFTPPPFGGPAGPLPGGFLPDSSL